MFRLIYITILLILPLQSIASVSYTVRIAVYNNAKSLQQELNKLSPALRKTIEIQKRGNQHVACSIHTENKETLKKLLPSYKKVFPDAFISPYQRIASNTTEVKKVLPEAIQKTDTIQTAKCNTTEVKKEFETKKEPLETIQKTDTITYSRKVINPMAKDVSLYDRFHQKTLYLCAYGKEPWSPNVLMQVDFFDKGVVYTPMMGEVPSKKEKYAIDNNKLYISHKGLFDSEVYSTLDSVTLEYYLISTWVGKKKVNTIRYYFDLEKAEAYVKTLK